MSEQSIWLATAFAVVAAIYASVGQAGASGYIAVMAMAGFTPMAMKTTALALNLLVAAIGSAFFLKTDRLSWRHIWPFAVIGVPASLLGGGTQLPEHIFFPVIAIILIFSGLQMAWSALRRGQVLTVAERNPPYLAAIITGGIIGLVSGTTGTGGGVFLAPVILAMKWATVRQTAAITAVYNLLNSGAALVGAYAFWGETPDEVPLWLAAVAIGGTLGAAIGSRYLPDRWLRAILALMLLFAGGQMVL